MENIGKAYFDSVEIDNPNSENWRDDLPAYMLTLEKQEQWKKLFGYEDTIIVGLHHQWLYGKSFVLVASMLINMNKVLTDKYASCNPFIGKNWEKGSGDLPRTIDSNNPMEGIRYLQDFMSNLFDFELGQYARTGIEGYSLLNGEYEGEVIARFDNGDCNDGVLIMDLITNKYCFINIGGDSTVEKLKRLNPVDASTYIKAYYPENENDCSADELEYSIKKSTPISFAQNLKVNKKFLKRFKGFKTLSVEELIGIFPVMNGDLIKHNKNETKKSMVKPANVLIPV